MTIIVTRGLAAATVAAALAAAMPATAAPLSLGTSPYTQDFNTLAASGTSSTLPAGWAFLESGSNANTTYAAGTGSSNTGNTYSFGSDAGDRALGSLASGSLQSQFGGFFTNGLATTISAISLAFTDEQWRAGTATADTNAFEYSLDATTLANGTWTAFNALDLVSLVTGGNTALDGNAAANRLALSGTISGLSIAQGGTFAIRWNDTDSTGSDNGLAVDDLTLTATPAATAAVPEPSSWAMLITGFGLVGGVARRRASTQRLPSAV